MALTTFVAGQQLSAAALNNNFTEVQRSALTIIPKPASAEGNDAFSSTSITDATTARIGLIDIPYRITVNKISILMGLVSTASTFDLTLYAEDGQSQIFSVTTGGTPTTNAILTTSVPSVTVLPGNYWLMINGNGTINMNTFFWAIQDAPFNTGGQSLSQSVTSEPVLQGTLAITAGTPPATITPAAITAAFYTIPVIRLDN